MLNFPSKDKAKHVCLLLAANVIYLLFIVRGLPNNHYLDWSQDYKIINCLGIIMFTVPLG